MSNGMQERFTLTSLRTSYGCVDWYPYDRQSPGNPPAGASRPESLARNSTGAALRPAGPVRSLPALPAGKDQGVLRL